METPAVRHWLSSLNLPEHYESLLLAAGYDSLAKCGRLNDAVLEQIGVKQNGHRKRILLHLPCVAEMEGDPFAPASPDSDEDDREIYDIPPVARKSGIVLTEENMYTNFVEMNEIPRPVLPQKKRLSSDAEVEARLGIISPPVKPCLSQGVFGVCPCSPESVRTKPKLCVVYPEKRPPVPARRISKEGKTSSVSVESPLNNNIEGFVMQKAALVSDPVVPVAMPRPFLKQQDTITEEESQVDPVAVTACEVSEPCATTIASVGPVHRAEFADVAPKLSVSWDAGHADAVLQSNMLTPGLEHELEEFVSAAKKPVQRKINTDTQTASSSGVSVHSVEVQPNDSVPIFASSSNVVSCDRTVSSFDSGNHQSLAIGVEQTTDGNASADAEAINVPHKSDLDCIYVVTDECAHTDSISQPSSLQNQELTVRDLEVKHSDDLVYVGLDKDHDNSCEYHYLPPSFPPPPLPDDFAPYGVFELSTYGKSDIDNQAPSSSTRTVSHHAEEVVQQTDCGKPQPPPRRRPSADTTSAVDDTTLSPLVAGFSSALDDYLSQKVTSPTSWLDQPSRSLSVVRNVSESDFEPFADLQTSESLLEITEGSDQQNQSLVSLDSDRDYLVPTSEKNVLYEFEKTADDALKSKKTKSCLENAPVVVKSLSADDFKEVPCNVETGD